MIRLPWQISVVNERFITPELIEPVSDYGSYQHWHFTLFWGILWEIRTNLEPVVTQTRAGGAPRYSGYWYISYIYMSCIWYISTYTWHNIYIYIYMTQPENPYRHEHDVMGIPTVWLFTSPVVLVKQKQNWREHAHHSVQTNKRRRSRKKKTRQCPSPTNHQNGFLHNNSLVVVVASETKG